MQTFLRIVIGLVACLVSVFIFICIGSLAHIGEKVATYEIIMQIIGSIAMLSIIGPIFYVIGCMILN